MIYPSEYERGKGVEIMHSAVIMMAMEFNPGKVGGEGMTMG